MWEQFAKISKELEVEYTESGIDWTGSPFEWIRHQPSSSRRGAIGAKLVGRWLASLGNSVEKCRGKGADCLVNKSRIEIKFSMLWEGGAYVFQQIRDQDYEFAVCLGVAPADASCWVIPKAELMKRWRESMKNGRASEGIVTQHAGSSGTDTAWLSIDPASPHQWLKRYGGSLQQASQALEAQLKPA